MHLKPVATCALALCLAGTETFAPEQMAQQPQEVTRENEVERNWWQNAVIYEIYPRSFQDTNRSEEPHV